MSHVPNVYHLIVTGLEFLKTALTNSLFYSVTLALCLVSWIDFLLHLENNKRGTAGELSRESLTIPSIVRQAQYDNLEAFVDRVQRDKNFSTCAVGRNMT